MAAHGRVVEDGKGLGYFNFPLSLTFQSDPSLSSSFKLFSSFSTRLTTFLNAFNAWLTG